MQLNCWRVSTNRRSTAIEDVRSVRDVAVNDASTLRSIATEDGSFEEERGIFRGWLLPRAALADSLPWAILFRAFSPPRVGNA